MVTRIHRMPLVQVGLVHEIERVDSDVEDEQKDSSKMCEIHNLEAEPLSDKEENPCDEWNVDDEADDCYKKLLRSEYKREYGVADLNGVCHPPSYLVMVTAKIQGSIFKCPCTMLIDTGSELNIMTNDHASTLELPVDPAGAAWTLRGVSGHQVALEGLCRDVPIMIGGVEVTHNFFITCNKLNGKDLILGKPLVFGYNT